MGKNYFLIILSSFLLTIFFLISLLYIDFENVISKPNQSSDGFQKNLRVVKEPKTVEIILTGDVMLGRTVMAKSFELDDTYYPFRKVADVLQSADLVFVNLENPVVDNCPPHDSGFVFCSNPDMLDGLVFAGVDVVTLANNHSQNYGAGGLDSTVRFLNERNILTTGVGDLVTKTIDETVFGFLGFDFTGPKSISDEDLLMVENSEENVDVLFVGVHWGEEYRDVHNNKQEEIARNLVDSGADVVVGHHPHWVQDVEYMDKKNSTFKDGVFKGVPVYYSLGNFVFDQMWSEETKKGMVVRLLFQNGELISEQRLPTYMSSWAQPEFVN